VAVGHPRTCLVLRESLRTERGWYRADPGRLRWGAQVRERRRSKLEAIGIRRVSRVLRCPAGKANHNHGPPVNLTIASALTHSEDSQIR
jgi:hypothetical protein